MPRPDLLTIFVNQSETVEMDLYYTQCNSCSLGPKDPKNGRKEGRKKEKNSDQDSNIKFSQILFLPLCSEQLQLVWFPSKGVCSPAHISLKM